MLIEFHWLQDHGPSNMNRDKEGRPKTAFYAGTQRLRISSQCLKRSLRQPRPADRPDAEPGVFEKTVGSGHFGVRTKLLPEKVAEAWIAQHGEEAPFLVGIKAAVSSVARKEGKEEAPAADGKSRTPQAIYLDLEREVQRIVAKLNQLLDATELESLADESTVFADHLVEAAKAVRWQEKNPEKKISWTSVRQQWADIKKAFEDLDVADRPPELEMASSAEALTPSPEIAQGLLAGLQQLQHQDEKRYKDLLKQLKPSKEVTPKKAGKSKSLAELLKMTGKQPVCAADIALFGRMTTSEAFQDVEAACQVADAISTHPVDIETDYFTARDDLDPAAGAAHIGEADYASAVFYKYLSIDFDALARNLGSEVPPDRIEDEVLRQSAAEAITVASNAVEGVLRALMQNVPSGKINSHAHNQAPSLVLVEVKPQHVATSYLTAFHEPARAGLYEDGTAETLLTDSVRKLLQFARFRDRKFPIPGTRRLLLALDPATEATVDRLRALLAQGEQSPLTDDPFFQKPQLAICATFDELVITLNDAIAQAGAQ